ncbi:MAG TPA: glycoside hydrolase [Kiritimatiellia bacterium]|nr:glycoside hydrolase [Kiritimatiellia bacterium]
MSKLSRSSAAASACALLFTLLSAANSVGQAAPTTLENPSLRVTVDPQAGTLDVLDKASGQRWFSAHTHKPGGAPRFRGLSRSGDALSFEADFGATDKRPNTVRVTMRLAGEGDLAVEADMADRGVALKPFVFLDPLVTDSANAALVVADYSNGHLYPANTNKPARAYFALSRMDMPWIGVCDTARGTGYMVLIETSDDGSLACPGFKVAGRDFAAPEIHWGPSKGTFAYPRKLIYHFVPRGGYVAMAKRYRTYAQQQGLIVPLAEKVKKNPNLERLFGAPDVWGDASLRFAREAKAAGVDKMLIHGRAAPEEMKAINDLGYLTSEYDNYTDVTPLGTNAVPTSSRDRIPESVVLKADGQRMTAWLTFDKKLQYMKRCPSLWVETAKQVVPQLLGKQPFLARFVDVTTAEDLYECYDPAHPLTRGQKRQCGVELLAFMRSQHLVVGGEHGIWWGVPQQDYIEGMMSGGYASWPAGHLLHPKTKTDAFTGPWGGGYGKWENYAQYGIGHATRVPLWELVFHDCVVSTWYWGDASDFLLQAAPEITPKKDAFNILYGTIPLLWANAEGSWPKHRDVFLRTYRNTCKLHEAVACTELLSHEWLTPDRAVQRTRFSDGTEVVVNFGEAPYDATVGGKSCRLPQNGWAVKGPKIEQSLTLVGDRAVTTIRADGYYFSDASGAELTQRAAGDARVLIQLGATRQPATLPLASFAPGWDASTTRIYQLSANGERDKQINIKPVDGAFQVGPFPEEAALEALCGAQAALPDLVVETLAVEPARPKPGAALTVTATVRNAGGAAAGDVEVACYADQVQPDRKLASQRVSLRAAGKAGLFGKDSRMLTFRIDPRTIDGRRELVIAINPDGRVKELCTANNRGLVTVDVPADYAALWQHHRTVAVEAGTLARTDEPVVLASELPATADPVSVRVVACGADGKPLSPVPAQLDKIGEKSELCFLLAGQTPAGAVRRFTVFWNDRAPEGKPGRVFSHLARLWQPDDSAAEGETYRVRLSNGALVDLAARSGGQTGAPFVSKLMVSSQETGWTDESGTVERCDVLAAGPVRAVVAVRKALNAGVAYEKVYTFYPRRIDVLASINKPLPLLSRAYYAQTGQYVDNAGTRAVVDGYGSDEGVLGKNPKPLWYAVYAERWAHACIALSPFSGVAYWDAGGSWGGIGFNAGARENVRMSYVVHPGAKDAAFAEEDYRQLTAPPQARWEK